MDYVQITKELHQFLGEPKPTTRIYQAKGSQEEAGRWYDAVTAAVGPTISLGAVHLYCPVSRASLYERVKRGKLTVFEFTVTERRTNFLGQSMTIKKEPFAYVPVSECRSWRADIEARAKEQGMTDATLAMANFSQFDELDKQVNEKENAIKKSQSANLVIPINQYELDYIEDVAVLMKYKSGGEFMADLLKPIIDGGFSGLSCTKAGLWMVRQMGKHGVGEMPLPKFIENLKRQKL
jgi:hypothetical protein